MPAKKTSVAIAEDLLSEILSRGAQSTVISRDLERLYTLYARSLKQVDLALAEASLIVDSLNSSLYDANSARMLWGGIEDSVMLEGLAEKWDVDGPALVEKLRGLNEIQSLAIIDASERFWEGKERNGDFEAAVKNCFEIK